MKPFKSLINSILQILLLFILVGVAGMYYTTKEDGKPFNFIKETSKATRGVFEDIKDGWVEADSTAVDTTSTP